MLYEVLKETKEQQVKMRFEQATMNSLKNDNNNFSYKVLYFISGVVMTLLSVGIFMYFDK
jgi:hypothetical protein